MRKLRHLLSGMFPHLSRGQLLCSYGRLMSSATSLDVIYDVAIIGGGMVGSALACALGETYPRQSPAFLLLPDLRGEVEKAKWRQPSFHLYALLQQADSNQVFCRQESFDRGS